jgi:hypothetical protein
MDIIREFLKPGNWLRVFIATQGNEYDLIYNIYQGYEGYQVSVETDEEFLYQEESVGGLSGFNQPYEGDYADEFIINDVDDIDISGKIIRIELFKGRPNSNITVLYDFEKEQRDIQKAYHYAKNISKYETGQLRLHFGRCKKDIDYLKNL